MTFALTLAAVAFCAWLLLRKRAQDTLSRKSDTHEVYVLALKEWLHEPEILDAIKRHCMRGTAEFALALINQPRLSEPAAKALTAKILENRTVRRVVAAHMAKRHGLDRKKVMRHIGEMLAEIKGGGVTREPLKDETPDYGHVCRTGRGGGVTAPEKPPCRECRH